MDKTIIDIVRKWQDENSSKEPSFITRVQLQKELSKRLDVCIRLLIEEGRIVQHESVNCTMYEVK